MVQKTVKKILIILVILVIYTIIAFPLGPWLSASFFYITSWMGLIACFALGAVLVVYLISLNKKNRKPKAALVDKERLENLRAMVQVSKRLKMSQMATALGMSEAALLQKIFKWAQEFGFTVDGDTVEFGSGRTDEFIASLEKEFSTWGSSGKV